jgi:hypothetical protein
MSALVEKLSEGWHPIAVSVRPEHSLKAFRECLDRGYVLIKFTGTKGGTELGISINQEQSDLTAADLNAGTGRLKVSGILKLDYISVRCIADIELPGLQGIGRLEPISA